MRFHRYSLAGILALILSLYWVTFSHGLVARALPQAERHVCPAGPPTCDYATIQEAVDAASAGDVVKVAAGTYTDVHDHGGLTQVVHIDKSVTIRGGYTPSRWDTPDPEANPTTLDAQGRGRVLYITGAVSPVLEGLRITGGDATGLGGGHWNEDAGGGVYVTSATATLKNCQVFSNTAQAGGGLFLKNSAATLIGNLVTANSARSTAGGSYGDGGGLFLDNSPARLERNVITANRAGFSGSGIYLGFGSNARLVNNVIAANDMLVVPYNLGCGVYVTASSPHLLHSTIHHNRGASDTGICLDSWAGSSNIELTNTILTNQAVGINVAAGSTATLNGVLWYHNSTANGQGAGTINIAHATSGDPAFAADGCHLTSGSAAIDRGVDAGVADDIDGQVRPYGAPDLGADEWYPEATATPTPTSTPITCKLWLPLMNRS